MAKDDELEDVFAFFDMHFEKPTREMHKEVAKKKAAADERHRALRAAEEHEAEEALALADAISTHCADDTFPRGGFCPLPRGV